MVYLAADCESGRPLALKVIRVLDAVTLEALQREADLQGQLALLTRTVPEVYSCGRDGDLCYIAMEYVDGYDLDEAIGGGRFLAPEQAATIVRAICACLVVAHTTQFAANGHVRSIVHGDIKPGNIRITRAGMVKLLDFGSARVLNGFQTSFDTNWLTVEYASPERLRTGRVDRNADLWGAGAVLFEAVVGRRPAEVSAQRTNNVYELPAWCPASLGRIVRKAIATRPEDRYRSAHALLRDLDVFLTHESHCPAYVGRAKH